LNECYLRENGFVCCYVVIDLFANEFGFQGGNPKLLLNSEIADSIATLKSHLQDLTPEGAQVLIRGNNSNQATFYPQENAGIQTM
jgi:hypothetical protein